MGQPGPTTNGWWRIGARLAGKDVGTPDWAEKAATALTQDDTSIGFGGANVDMKDGKTKAGLPWEDEVDASDNCSKRLVPEASKADASQPKSWPWTPSGTSSKEQLVPTTAMLAGDEPVDSPAMEAAMEVLTTCTIITKQSGDGWAAGSWEAMLEMAGLIEAAGCEDWNENSGKTAKLTSGKRPASQLWHVWRLIARIRNDSPKSKLQNTCQQPEICKDQLGTQRIGEDQLKCNMKDMQATRRAASS